MTSERDKSRCASQLLLPCQRSCVCVLPKERAHCLIRPERYWGVLVLLVMLALGDALGLVGLLLAQPVAVALQIALNQLLQPRTAPNPAPGATDLQKLCQRLATLRQRLNAAEVEASPRVQNLVLKLESLLAEAEAPAVEDATPTRA